MSGYYYYSFGAKQLLNFHTNTTDTYSEWYWPIRMVYGHLEVRNELFQWSLIVSVHHWQMLHWVPTGRAISWNKAMLFSQWLQVSHRLLRGQFTESVDKPLIYITNGLTKKLIIIHIINMLGLGGHERIWSALRPWVDACGFDSAFLQRLWGRQ